MLELEKLSPRQHEIALLIGKGMSDELLPVAWMYDTVTQKDAVCVEVPPPEWIRATNVRPLYTRPTPASEVTEAALMEILNRLHEHGFLDADELVVAHETLSSTRAALSAAPKVDKKLVSDAEEALHHLRDGTFYEHYDAAAGPWLRALDAAVTTLKATRHV